VVARRPSGWHRESRRLGAAMGWRTCATCGERKRSDAFYPHPDTPDGISPDCKACEGYWMATGHIRPRRREPAK